MKAFICGITVLLLAMAAHADIYDFYSIAPNPEGIGTQLQMDVNVLSPGLARITFSNAGPVQSVVSEIYFDAPETPPINLTVQNIINGPGVSFYENANPANLPGGTDPLINFISDEDVEAGNPAPQKGIGVGKYLTVELSYTDPSRDFITMLNAGELRVGLHTISIGTNEVSEGFINNIPEPTSMVFCSVTALSVLFIRRRGFFYRTVS